MFLLVLSSCKTLGPISRKIDGHKRTTGEAGIATARVRCRELKDDNHLFDWLINCVTLNHL